MLSHKYYYGLHRVLFPVNVFPQPAWSLNPNLPINSTELLVDIVSLHIDSVSFAQLKQDTNLSIELMKQQIINFVRERGQMHNPVTGSGDVFIKRYSSHL
jgi:L-erythro-3,5-diaminohexanoate dehydrogenase